MAIYIIGDIQGCIDPLQRLLDKVHFDPSDDQLWCPGDLVNRGGQSLEVLRLMNQLGKSAKVTLGNHDLSLLREDHRHPGGGSRNKEFKAILKAHDRKELMAWLRKRPLAHWSKKHNVLMVHAGVLPQWSRKSTLKYAAEVSAVIRSGNRGAFFKRMYGNQPVLWKPKRKGWSRLRLITNVLTRLRFCDRDGRLMLRLNGPPGSHPKGYLPWFKHPDRRTRKINMVFGHWAALGLYRSKRVTCLDSGCVWGGKLTALRLEDQRLFRVKGKKR
jgi:bis(5'-nucleosyl)-tetraphosphatase (symmetrical)